MKVRNIAGILGLVDKQSRVDEAILAAISDGMDAVIIFGGITDGAWYYKRIEPIIKSYPDKVKYAGGVANRQSAYDVVSDIYDFSRSAASRVVRRECLQTGVSFHGR